MYGVDVDLLWIYNIVKIVDRDVLDKYSDDDWNYWYYSWDTYGYWDDDGYGIWPLNS